MIKAKIHERRTPQGGVHEVLAMCDENLLGKVFEQGEKVLDLKLYRSFYDGEEVSHAQAVELLRNATNANIVGKASVKAADEVQKGASKNARTIAGVPHLQIYKV
ncbi:MAG TPA: DUF424 domain-containing protein [Candidatus Norongarragalinales archaeon]|jgi:hypothetical protein|nr:DUF424 domain-containing protein [Candidatus Norongarragalinales archaeon]